MIRLWIITLALVSLAFGVHAAWRQFGRESHELVEHAPLRGHPGMSLERAASQLGIDGVPFQGFGGEALVVHTVAASSQGSRMGVRPGDRLRWASNAGIPLTRPEKRNDPARLHSVVVQRRGASQFLLAMPLRTDRPGPALRDPIAAPGMMAAR